MTLASDLDPFGHGECEYELRSLPHLLIAVSKGLHVHLWPGMLASFHRIVVDQSARVDFIQHHFRVSVDSSDDFCSLNTLQ